MNHIRAQGQHPQGSLEEGYEPGEVELRADLLVLEKETGGDGEARGFNMGCGVACG